MTNLFEQSIVGGCVEVCRNGLRIEVSDAIPEETEFALKSPSLGLSGRAVVRYCHRNGPKYLIGVEFVSGLEWRPPDRGAAETSLSAGMTERTADIFQALLGGALIEDLQARINDLTSDERDILLCTASCIQTAVAANCQERADEIERLLVTNRPAKGVALLAV